MGVWIEVHFSDPDKLTELFLKDDHGRWDNGFAGDGELSTDEMLVKLKELVDR